MTLRDDLREVLGREHDAFDHAESGVCDCPPDCADCRIIDASDLRTMRDRLKVLILEDGGCDHSVGICACGEENLIAQADVELGDAEWCDCGDEYTFLCGRCHGNGIIYKQKEGG